MRKPPALPIPRTGGGATTKNACVLDGRKLGKQRPLDRLRRLIGIFGPLIERLQHHEHGAGIGSIGACRSRKADDVHGVGDAGNLERKLDCPPVDGIGAVERCSRRQLRHGDQIAAIDRRNKADRGLTEFVHAEGDDAGVDDEHDNGDAHQSADHPGVAAGELLEAPVKDAEEGVERPHVPSRAVAFAMRLQQHGTQGRRQRQRHDERDDRRTRDRQRELPVELAGDAGDEGRRHEHRGEHQVR